MFQAVSDSYVISDVKSPLDTLVPVEMVNILFIRFIRNVLMEES